MGKCSLRNSIILTVSMIIVFITVPVLGAPPGSENGTDSEPLDCIDYDYCSERTVIGHSKGNHELNCTVIRPWNTADVSNSDIPANGYPVIIWANGWGWNNNAGETTTIGYKRGLIEWALSGPYIVVAANAWSAQESDVLECLEWILNQDDNQESNYYDIINTKKIGLSGHSQGGGAIIKAGGNGEKKVGEKITATLPMNPYGPAWVNPGDQEGPMLILGGANDTTTPPESYQAVWDQVSNNGIFGSFNAVLPSGTHNNEAWGVYPNGETMSNEDAGEVPFGDNYKYVSELWWDCWLNNSPGSCADLATELNSGGWELQ